MMTDFKSLFMLDPAITFLNHGSFGACPQPVFEVYQAWQRQLERQPVLFLGRELGAHYAEMRAALGAFIGAAPTDVVGVTNATTAVNIVARSLVLGAGDEVLATDHEYGACDYTWQMLSQQQGFVYKRQPISLPLTTPEALLAQIWAGVTAATKVIFISHISSTTAVRFPVAALCARAREAGILTVIDGAHAVGQLPLDMAALGADFYTSNTHKWLCAPKGSAFLYVRPEHQAIIKPLVVSWGYHADDQFTTGSQFLDYLSWSGTMDPAALLSIPAAIAFQQKHNWSQVQANCRDLVTLWIHEAAKISGIPAIYPDDTNWFYQQLGVAPMPAGVDPLWLKQQLYDSYQIEVPVTQWRDQVFIRIAVQAYNNEADVRTLLAALAAILA